MKIYDAKVSFASGELSPALYARIDLAQYATGAREITNFLVLPQGAVINRPGTSRLSNKVYSSVRLVPFVFSEEDSCVLVFYNGFVDCYDYSGLVETISNSPYGTKHLKKLRWLQSADVLYLFHPEVPVHTLSRTSEGWKFNEIEFEHGPFEDINTDPKITFEFWYRKSTQDFSVLVMGDNSKLIAKDIKEGVLIRVEHEIKAASFELEIPKGTDNDTFGEWVLVENVFGAFTYRTSGRWSGSLEIQRCKPEGWVNKNPEDWEWEDFKNYTSEKDAEENFSFSGTVEEFANHYRFRYKGRNKKVILSFSYEGGLDNRVFKITRVPVGTILGIYTAIDVDGKKGNIPATDAWAIGSFGTHYGYPSMGIFHQERLILASTLHSPQTIYMSQPASWHDFGISIPAKDDDAITITLASKEINEIRGLASRGDLLIFTAGGEWIAKAGSKSDVFTPSSIVITPSGYRGSSYIEPLDVGDITLFVQRQGTCIRSIGYTLEVDGYSSQDISILASHIFENNPVKSWAYQQTPYSIVWCVLSSGDIAALTLQKEHQVNAWTRQIFEHGLIQDVCSIPGDTQDDIYLAVKSGFEIFIERLNRRLINFSQTFLDGGLTPVHSILECLDWEIKDNRGTSQGRHKHIPVMTLRLWQTKMLKGIILTENTGTEFELDELQFPLQNSPGEYNLGLFNGDVRLIPSGGISRTCRVRLENDKASPVMILGIFPEVLISNEEINNES